MTLASGTRNIKTPTEGMEWIGLDGAVFLSTKVKRRRLLFYIRNSVESGTLPTHCTQQKYVPGEENLAG